MTAWHDQPPVSRRQVRQTERDEDVDLSSTPEQNTPEDTSFAGIARQGWEAEARRASLPQGEPARPEGEPESRANSAVARVTSGSSRNNNSRVPSAEPARPIASI